MSRLACLLLLLISSPAWAEPRIVAYYTEWSVFDRKFNVADIPGDKLTHVIYAFARITDGEPALFDRYAAIDKFYPGDKWDAGFLRGNFHQLQLLKKKHKHLKTMIAIGGWTLSGPFSDVALTAAAREKFAKSAVAFMTKYDFDGIDLDWEYPVSGGLSTNKTRREDRENYTHLVAELRSHLDHQSKKTGRKYLLTIAAPAGPTTRGNLELAKLSKHLDWFNLMSYDFHGGWGPLTHFNAPLYAIKDDPTKDKVIRESFNVDATVRGYRDAGVPADKIVMGVPFYGRGWTGVKEAGNGLFAKPAPGLPKGTWEPGLFDYKDLAKNYVGKYPRHWSKEAKVPWLYDPKTGTMISYDDAESMKIKAAYARDNKLGGVMIWEISADDAKSTLLTTINAELKAKKR